MTRANERPIIIRKTDAETADGHHGGAWKVAYADFMTAMMAFFLLMWILSTASKDQLNGIADYFTPSTVAAHSRGGTGALGGTALGPKGTRGASQGLQADATGNGLHRAVKPPKAPSPVNAMRSAEAQSYHVSLETQAHPVPPTDKSPSPAPAAKVGAANAHGQTENAKTAAHPHPAKAAPTPAEIARANRALDKKRFAEIQKEIVQAMQSAPDLRPLMKNVLFQQTPQGLKIQIIDQAGRPMFASGSSEVTGPTLDLMQRLGRALAKLPNTLTISGHTDSVPYADGAQLDNWALSSDRANATRRVLVAAGVEAKRVTQIAGLADTQPLKPNDPSAASNRRISILLAYRKSPQSDPAVTAGESVQAIDAALKGVGHAVAPPQPKPPATTAAAQPNAGSAAPLVHHRADAGAPHPAPATKTAQNASGLAAQYSLVSLADLSRSLK